MGSIESEFRRYRALGEAAFAQLADEQLCVPLHDGAGLSVATVAWHVGGNLASRFTDFLTSDGEKPWRDRDAEFEPRAVNREQLLTHWARGWDALFEALRTLTDADLQRTVSIRGRPLPVHEALHRALAHAAYHTGQIVYVAKLLRGAAWQSLSIPPGGSRAYDAAPTRESGAAHAARLDRPDVDKRKL